MYKYQHLQFYIPETRGKHNTDTYAFLSTKFKMPTNTNILCASTALEEFVGALKRMIQYPLHQKLLTTQLWPSKIVVSYRTDNSKNGASVPRVNLTLPKTNVTATSRVAQIDDVATPSVAQADDAVISRMAQVNDAATPRVQRLSRLTQNSKKISLKICLQGTYIYKKFRTKYHQGVICDFDAKERYYKAKYNDGGSEEYTKDKIKNILQKTDERNIQELMAITRHEQVEADYCQINLEYNPKNVESVTGYSNAMNWIEYQELNRCEHNPTFQGYKYAKGVLDEEICCILELRDLL